METKYKLIVKEGFYESDSLFSLFIEIIRHRFEHLWYEGKWKD
jgi:hypothetical protein